MFDLKYIALSVFFVLCFSPLIVSGFMSELRPSNSKINEVTNFDDYEKGSPKKNREPTTLGDLNIIVEKLLKMESAALKHQQKVKEELRVLRNATLLLLSVMSSKAALECQGIMDISNHVKLLHSSLTNLEPQIASRYPEEESDGERDSGGSVLVIEDVEEENIITPPIEDSEVNIYHDHDNEEDSVKPAEEEDLSNAAGEEVDTSIPHLEENGESKHILEDEDILKGGDMEIEEEPDFENETEIMIDTTEAYEYNTINDLVASTNDVIDQEFEFHTISHSESEHFPVEAGDLVLETTVVADNMQIENNSEHHTEYDLVSTSSEVDTITPLPITFSAASQETSELITSTTTKFEPTTDTSTSEQTFATSSISTTTTTTSEQTYTTAKSPKPTTPKEKKPQIVCPRGSEAIGTECFSVHLEERLNWTSSRGFCRNRGGDLAEPNLFNDKLPKQLARKWPELKESSFWTLWVGATDQEIEGEWHWVTGGLLEVKQAYRWDLREPPGFGDTQDCLAMILWVAGRFQRWDLLDDPCHLEWFVFCEYTKIV